MWGFAPGGDLQSVVTTPARIVSILFNDVERYQKARGPNVVVHNSHHKSPRSTPHITFVLPMRTHTLGRVTFQLLSVSMWVTG